MAVIHVASNRSLRLSKLFEMCVYLFFIHGPIYLHPKTIIIYCFNCSINKSSRSSATIELNDALAAARSPSATYILFVQAINIQTGITRNVPQAFVFLSFYSLTFFQEIKFLPSQNGNDGTACRPSRVPLLTFGKELGG